MNISFRESCFLKKLPNMEGSFGYLATHKTLSNGTVIKVIKNMTKGKEEIIEELVKSDMILGSGYPIEEYHVDGNIQGFIMHYYKKARTFEYAIYNNKFTHKEKVKATLDCTNQLKELHKKEFLLNDIALSNSLIDKKGGHLIDFDSATKERPRKAESHYDLTFNNGIIRPSYNLDKFKQALTNLAVIYDINFEDIMYERTTDVKSIISLFKDNKEVFNLLNSYLSNDNSKPYFDILKDAFADEEKVMFESAKIYRKAYLLV